MLQAKAILALALTAALHSVALTRLEAPVDKVIPMAEEERQAVPLKDLPPLVQQRLAEDFAGWAATTAAKLERNDYIHYFVTLRGSAGETKVVEVLENGEVVRPMRKP